MPEGRVFRREQHRRAIERFREFSLVRKCELFRREEHHAAFAEQVAERADADRGAHGRIGNHDIEVVHGELGEQALGFVLATHEMHGLGMRQRRLEDAPRDELRHDIGDAHHETERPADWTTAHGFAKLAPEREDFVRIAKRHATRLGEHQATADPHEELFTERLLERFHLAAHRRLGEPELTPRAREPALARHEPKIQKMVVIEPLHGFGRYFEKTEESSRYFLIVEVSPFCLDPWIPLRSPA
jgi:hypothetical protein